MLYLKKINMKEHWNLTYVFNRIKAGIYWKLNQDKPWLTKLANAYLDKHLTDEMVGLEFGSGRSTIYFSNKLAHLTSVENHEGWHSKIQSKLQSKGISNVDYLLKTVNEKEPDNSTYHKVANEFTESHFDFILVDGQLRGLCAVNSIDKLKSKGIFVVDNANWYLPCDSISPKSIPFDGQEKDETWKQFNEKVKDWKKVWTSNGVTDTAIFIKP